MRSTITVLVVLSTLAITFQPSARGQYAAPIQAGQAGAQAPVHGYYVPVVTTEYAAQPAGLSVRVSDSNNFMSSPMVSRDCAADCGCGACDQRGDRGCGRNCSCLRCRHDRLFSQAFGSVEYLHWYNKGITLPPLVTTSPAGTAQAAAGVLPGATTLFGGNDIDDDLQAAGRLMFGWWLDDCCNLAIAAKLYAVEDGTVGFTATSAGTPILGRPFFNTDAGVNAEDALLVAFPGVTAGTVTVTAENDVFGLEVFGRSMLDATDDYRLDLIGGYQFNRIDSDLAMSSIHLTGAGDFFFTDLFDVENQFHAGSMGIYGESYHDCWTFSALGKIAVGNMRQTVNIAGSNTVVAGGTVTTPGGLFAQPTNIGTFERDILCWAPEASFKLSCALTQQVSVSVGYSFVYFTRVAFAGDQVDRNVNATQLNGGPVVGPINPAFTFRDTDFWIQTIDLGLTWNY